MQEMWVQYLSWEDSLENEMATCSSIHAWEIPWTEDRGRLQSMESQKNQTQLNDSTATTKKGKTIEQTIDKWFQGIGEGRKSEHKRNFLVYWNCSVSCDGGYLSKYLSKCLTSLSNKNVNFTGCKNFFVNWFIYFNWRQITLQSCSDFCHTFTWISHGCTCVPHPESPSHLPPHPIPQGHRWV